MTDGLTSAALAAIDPELKEAVCDALVNLTVRRVSGSDDEGRMIFGRSPRRAIFSGQLLPRFDEAGQEDETSDIRIAALGLDLSMHAGVVGDCTAQPRFSVYIRVLPTWEDLQDPRRGIDIDFKLNRVIQDGIDATIRARRDQLFAERGVDRPNWRDLTEAARAEVRRVRSEIQETVRLEAYAAQGIRLERGDGAIGGVEAEGPDQEGGADSGEPDAQLGGEIDDGAAPRPPIAALLRQGRLIPFALIEPAPIPGKWARLDLDLPVASWPAGASDADLQALEAAYNAELRQAAATQVATWLASDEGQRQVWRNATIRPEHVQDEAAFDAYLAGVRALPIQANEVSPDFTRLTLKVERQTDFLDPATLSVRVTLDNQAPELNARAALLRCNALFASSLTVSLPTAAHQPLRLDRVEPSYRFRHFLDYPAIGLNCGVVASEAGGTTWLTTSWSPRFVQPRIVPRAIDLPTQFSRLADPDFDVEDLLELPRLYGEWVTANVGSLAGQVRQGLNSEDADIESRRLATDEAGQRAEANYIRRGVQLLVESQAAARQLADGAPPARAAELTARAAPWRAWTLVNRSFLQRDGGNVTRGWRLFQLAFILAHIPSLASRMPEFRAFYDQALDEDSVSLLYFPTGGGKSEAFYGTLLFGLFLDRLRGKDRGVTAMVRYPLRLLTLQQAQRLLKLLVHAEIVRKAEQIGSWPFEIGFWVGASNTPNHYSAITAEVPLFTDDDFPDDGPLEEPAAEGQTWVNRARKYRDLRAAYNKVPSCPCCGEGTGLRRYEVEGPTARRLAIICFNDVCSWNQAHGHREPLPFLLTDDTIYARAPAVVLGTVDKLAMLGQHTETITKVIGMFGMARWIGPTGHLYSPRRIDDLRAGPAASGYEPVFPAYRGGRQVFVDPFPSLIIQDEAHLLEESLGTFSGLFDTLLEHVFSELAGAVGDDLHVARRWTGDEWGAPRTPKIIAATATISNPDRQIEVLYQRRALRFPYPGPDIYHSFFAEPAPPPAANGDRLALARELAPALAPEATAPWMRLYVSLMTNDATHTVTSVHVLGTFHAIIAGLWRGLLEAGSRPATVAALRAAVGPGRDGDWRRAAIDRATAEGRLDDLIAVVDLHRIALAYVTNKKGGDQIMDALDAAVRQSHRAASISMDRFDSRLISGGIDMKQIQRVMEDAETSFAGAPYPAIDATVRNIVATSAISHGVDVDRFNSMFFAGLPSDIAEYIQASSRVGRSHVGFVMLLPTPQNRRDRYVVETHDIFHRFLERMIAPPAVERWAENAIRRVLASFVQAWAMTREACDFARRSDQTKDMTPAYDVVSRLGAMARREPVQFPDEVGEFILQAIGFAGRGRDAVGRPSYAEHYRALVDRESRDFSTAMQRQETASRFMEYWKDVAPVFKQPMTSLRDVDEAGYIVAAAYDPGSRGNNTRVDRAALARVMKAIRSQRGDGAETDAERDGDTA